VITVLFEHRVVAGQADLFPASALADEMNGLVVFRCGHLWLSFPLGKPPAAGNGFPTRFDTTLLLPGAQAR
jgi:hypothetical protein